MEFLTRKVKTLQDKLAATSSQDTTPTAVPLPIASTSAAGPSQSASRSHPPPPTRVVPSLPEMPDFSSAASTSRQRARGASSMSPDDRMPQPVFRARTPEMKAQAAQPPVPLGDPFPMSTSTSSSIGIKRRAPDDFEDCDSVPPQPFTADSVPHGDGINTPRMRRALQSVRTGFTPTRHVRPAPSRGSPPRRSTTGPSAIADVTNSPRSKAGAKRGWLGKIKGGSGRATSSRPHPDRRPQNAGP